MIKPISLLYIQIKIFQTRTKLGKLQVGGWKVIEPLPGRAHYNTAARDLVRGEGCTADPFTAAAAPRTREERRSWGKKRRLALPRFTSRWSPFQQHHLLLDAARSSRVCLCGRVHLCFCIALPAPFLGTRVRLERENEKDY